MAEPGFFHPESGCRRASRVQLTHSGPPAFSRVEGKFPPTISPLQPRGSSSSDAQPLIIKGILFFAALPHKCSWCLTLFVSHTPAVILFLLPSLPCFVSRALFISGCAAPAAQGLRFPFPRSQEPANPEPLPASTLMNLLCLVCPELIAHKLRPVGTQGLFVPARITCPPRSLRPRPAVPEGHPAGMHCQRDPCGQGGMGQVAAGRKLEQGAEALPEPFGSSSLK